MSVNTFPLQVFDFGVSLSAITYNMYWPKSPYYIGGLKRVFYRLPSLYEQKNCHKSTLTSINCHLLKALSVLYNINTI